MDSVAIIMATYNGEKFLKEQIESILSSTYKEFKLYIVDDGSKDSTMEILHRYKMRYPGVIHVSQNEKNMGVTLNFLNAINRTTSDYIMLCDQDDVWKKDKIAKTLNRMKQIEVQFGKDLPVAVFTDAYVTDSKLNIIHPSFFKSGRLNPQLTDLPHMLMENKLIGCTVMINGALRRILQSRPLPKKARFHDGWLGLIAASFGKISFIPEPTLFYRQHETNVVGNRGFCSYVLNRLRNLRKQKEALIALQEQAKEFADLYRDYFDGKKLELVVRFSDLSKDGFIKRRIQLLRYGYLKSGLIRNIGLMFII